MEIAEYQFLVSTQGQKLLEIARQYPDLFSRLQVLRKQTSADKASVVSQQVELQNKAQEKFAQAQQMIFDREGLEQSSGEIVAQYVAERFQRFSLVADLTCGIGGDSIGLSQYCSVIACDKLFSKTLLCRHNVQAYGRNCFAINTDVSQWFPETEAYFIDPSRRVAGKRVFQLQDSQPGIETLEKIFAITPNVAIKASPGINYQTIPFACEIEIISFQGECRQAILWLGDLAQRQRCATQLPQRITLELNPNACTEISDPRQYLYEVEKTAMRANLVETLAEQHQLYLLDPRLSYLTGDAIHQSPWLQGYRIELVMPFSEKKVRQQLRQRDIGHLVVKARGFVKDSVYWKKRFTCQGTQSATLFLTRIQEKPYAIFAQAFTS